MKKFCFLGVVFASILCSMLQSCDDDDNNSSGKYMTAMATVQKESGAVYPYFVLDNGKTMWVSVPLVPFQNLVPGQRILGDFTLLYDDKEGFDYYVRLNSYTKALTKPVINLTEMNKDSIGNDSITIKRMWLGANYLNAEFLMEAPAYEDRMINLVFNRLIPQENDGYVHLEFRYNNLGENNNFQVPGLASFILGEYGPQGGSGYKGLKVKVNSVKGEEKMYTFDFANDTKE